MGFFSIYRHRAFASFRPFPWLFVLVGFLICIFFTLKNEARADSNDWLMGSSFLISGDPLTEEIPAVEGDIVIYKSAYDLYAKDMSSDLPAVKINGDDHVSNYLQQIDIKSRKGFYEKSTNAYCQKDLSGDSSQWSTAPEKCLQGTTGTVITASDDGNEIYFGEVDGGIDHIDFLSDAPYDHIHNGGGNPFFSNLYGVIWAESEPYQGRYSSGMIESQAEPLTGRGCGVYTARANPKAIGSFLFYDRALNESPIDYDIYTYTGDPTATDSTRCSEIPLIQAPGNQQDSEFINYADGAGQHHTLIVWEDSRNATWDIYMKDLLTGEEVPVCQCDGDQINPDITLDADGQPFIVWQDHRNGNWDIYGTKASLPQDLAKKFRPELIIFPDDYIPVLVDLATDLTTEDGNRSVLKDSANPGWQQIVDIAGLSTFNGPAIGANYYLDVPRSADDGDAHKSDYQHFRSIDGNTFNYPATIYARISPMHDIHTGEKKTAIQYWLYYYFNDMYCHALFGEGYCHEGDWELVEVILNNDMQPETATYSQHGQGRDRPWSDVATSESHPRVYVSKGGHANYFDSHDAGGFLWEPGSYDQLFDTSWGSPNQEVVEPDIRLIELGSPAWLNYNGRWGEPDGDGPFGPVFNGLGPEENDGLTQGLAWVDELGWWGNTHDLGYVNDTVAELERNSDTGESSLNDVTVKIYNLDGSLAVGKDVDGGVTEAVPGSEYISWPDGTSAAMIHRAGVVSGYTIEVESASSNSFSFQLNLPQYDQGLVDKPVYNVAMPAGAKGRITVAEAGSPQDYSMQLDTNADGNFDDGSISPTVSTENADFIGPDAITDLSASSVGPDFVDLSWTATGDNHIDGRASGYEIRYSNSEIVDEYSWLTAKRVPNQLVPHVVGTTETFRVEGLASGDYYFAVRARDDVNLEAAVSNSAFANIPFPRVTSVSPSGTLNSSSTVISISYEEESPGTGINPSLVNVTLDGQPLSGCSVSAGAANCPVTGLSIGDHVIGGSVADYVGNSAAINGGFSVIDELEPVIEAVQPIGTIGAESATIVVSYSDPSPASGINTLAVSILVDGNLMSNCVVSATTTSCPVSALSLGAHDVAGSVADNAGNIAFISGNFVVADQSAPVITNQQPSGSIYTDSTTITVGYDDPAPTSGINTSAVTVSVDGNILIGCTVNASSTACPVSGLLPGNHSIAGSISDNAGNVTPIAGGFAVVRNYFWPWYDYQSAGYQDWVLFANPAGASADLRFADLMIGGLNYTLPSLPGYSPGQVPAGRALSASFPGTMNGPVQAVSTTGARGVLSQRTLLNGNSLEEVPAQEWSQLSDHFVWPWYQNYVAGETDWVMVANPNSSSVWCEIKIAGVLKFSGTVQPHAKVSPNFPNTYGQLLDVSAWTDQSKSTPAKVMASQRVTYTSGPSFNELPGTPYGNLSSSYYWTWYDNSSAGMADRFFLANPNASQIYYEIWIAGTRRDFGTIAASGFTTKTFPGVMGGPVKVQSWTNSTKQTPANIVASRRINYNSSFEEIAGYAQSALTSDYLWPWYDYSSSQTPNWVLVINPNASSVYYEISVAGVLKSYGTLAAGANVTPTYFGVHDGPVEVQAWTSSNKQTPANVFASQRVIWNGYFNEVVGTVLN